MIIMMILTELTRPEQDLWRAGSGVTVKSVDNSCRII